MSVNGAGFLDLNIVMRPKIDEYFNQVKRILQKLNDQGYLNVTFCGEYYKPMAVKATEFYVLVFKLKSFDDLDLLDLLIRYKDGAKKSVSLTKKRNWDKLL